MNTTRFLGLECVSLSNDALTLLVTKDVGPRILALSLGGEDNLFAELPDLSLDYPGGGAYHLYGGHRLWHAPEVPERTYLADDGPVEISRLPDGLRVIQAVEPQTGLQKSVRIRLPDQRATVMVDHTLANHGMWPITCAPWAITQCKAGGVAILPQNAGLADVHGVQPNRNLVLWPYTDLRSQHVTWGNRYIFVRAAFKSGAFKVAFPNPRGWLAYYRQGTLFVKYANYRPAEEYYDTGGSSQCYCQPRFLELETLGPKTLLPAGESVTHREVWRVFRCADFEPAEESMQQVVADLGIEAFTL